MTPTLHSRYACNRRPTRSLLFAAAILFLSWPTAVHGFSLWVAGGAPADLINEPDNFYSFEEDVITWKMDDDFRALFNTADLRQQVRLAVQEWETAFNSDDRRDSTRYGYQRRTGPQNFYDLRSVIVHEMGHALGLQHPDASHFNIDDATDQPYAKNFRINAGGQLYLTPPIGGEVMNEGWDEDSLPASKPPKGLPTGAYWQTVSQDELQALDYAYGRPISFMEVGPEAEALITIGLFEGGGADGITLGNSGPDGSRQRESGNPSAGRWINLSSANISDNAPFPIGILPRAAAWSYRNTTGEAVEAMTIATEGTSNPDPLDVYSSGPRRFTTMEPSNVVDQNDAEWHSHRFSDPVAGSIPGGHRIELGLELDVWDWTVASANVRTTGGDLHPAALLTFVDWAEGEANYAPESLPDTSEALLTARREKFVISHRGFRIVNGETPTKVVEIGFASVADLALKLDDLTPELLDQLATAGKLVQLQMEPTDLGRSSELVIAMNGLADDLPAELLASGDFRLFNDAHWADAYAKGEILVYGKTVNADHEVTAFSLLNSAVIAGGGVPEPSAGFLAIVAFAIVLGGRGRPAAKRLLS